MRHNILPSEYYAYGLWRPDRKTNIDNYLFSHEAARVFKLLNRPLKNDPIDDKLAFYEMCKTNALPTPAVLAAFAPTGTLLEFQSGQPPELDLFVKPRVGLAGAGAERFRWRGNAFESSSGYRLGRQELVDHLKVRARTEERTLLVQPNLSNHSELGVEADGALATARLVSGRLGNDVVAIFGFIYFGRSGCITAQHGHVALIDVESGRLVQSSMPGGLAAQAVYAFKYPHGVPEWSLALQHVRTAHKLCSHITFVGWDIAFTEGGPMLLEGNANWSADEYQSLTGEPLGHTMFSEILAARLRDH
jgi:hypothetical protein